ncbi:MAG TPA: polyphosphate kinase 2 family protein [Caldilineaceae bacterium]|nr:polyphosphate kinase 2 family protein [Caldilineaceae bacterium]
MEGVEQYRVQPNQTVRLDEWNPSDRSGFQGTKREAQAQLQQMNRRLEALQELLWAERKHKVLIILQAMDTGGKDSAIRHVFEGVNPQGVKVHSFTAPTAEELAHDFLWRVHKHTPGSGEIAIFNRSHYEDVLVVRVHGLAPDEVCRRRFEHINAFEKLLADEGTTIRKFFLHISKAEQRKQLQERLDDPTKRWKFHKSDLAERERWADYQHAYEDVLSRTSTDYAPWYIVPGNHRWYRNLVVAQVVIEALDQLEMRYPEPEEGLEGIVVE